MQCNKPGSSKEDVEETHQRSPRKRKSSERLFPEECIFCGQKKKGQVKQLKKFASFRGKTPAWKSIEEESQALGETRLHRLVQGQDLFAKEAQYHEKCYSSFKLRCVAHRRSQTVEIPPDSESDQIRRAGVHRQALMKVMQYIQENVIQNNEVVQLSYLRGMYVQYCEYNNFPSREYESRSLKHALLKSELNDFIGFTTVDPGNKGFISYVLIYNAQLSVADAIAYVYQLGSKDKLEECAIFLRKTIQHAFEESESVPWPPTAADLDVDPSIPKELTKFLKFVVSGDNSSECERSHRLVLSIGQDIARAVTNGEWKLPKQILLGETIRHLYRSKNLVTILNKLGHCELYDFCLELETAMAKALEEVSTHLTPQIITGEDNVVFHMEWDNMNKLTTNIHGNNVVNSTGGIMIQEVKSDVDPSSRARTLPVYDQSKTRSLKSDVPKSWLNSIFTRV